MSENSNNSFSSENSPQNAQPPAGGSQSYGQQYAQQPNYNQQNFQQPGYQQQPDFDAYGNPIAPDAKTMSLLSHLSSLILNFVTATTLSFLGPLIFWFIFKDKPGHQFTAANSARAFNFNFTMWLANLLGWLVMIFTLGIGVPISGLIWFATTVLMFIFHIIAAIRASRGEVYNYPMQIKILKD